MSGTYEMVTVPQYELDTLRKQRDALVAAAAGLYDTVQDLRHVINGVLAGNGLDDTLDYVMVRGKKRIIAYHAALALVKGGYK